MFLADALIEVIPSGEDKVTVVINTFDQWTTNIPIGGQFLGNEFLYWFGVLESNLLGTGQTIGFFFWIATPIGESTKTRPSSGDRYGCSDCWGNPPTATTTSIP